MITLIPLLTGCAATHLPEAKAGEAARAPAAVCFVTEGGIEVSSQVGRCPDRKTVEAETARFLARMGAPAAALDGVKIVFVPFWMECSGVMAWGCTRGRTILVNLSGEGAGRLVRPTGSEFPDEAIWQRSYDWRNTMVHEMGHVLRAEAGLRGDSTHQDRWWWTVAENRGTATPAFASTDARSMAVKSIAARPRTGQVASN
jgi:hypothetical protein